MKVVAINSSPNMDKGNTSLILTPFLDGMKEAGAEVELFYTKKLDINPCQGEFNCWYKTPGKCFQNDDMQMLLPKLLKADVVVYATPLYIDGINGPMKNLWDRVIPGVLPYFELRDGHCRHPLHDGVKMGKVVLVSNCGFWELDNFDALLVHIKSFCKNANTEFAGALLRPHGGGLKVFMELGLKIEDIFEAAKNAGQQLVEVGKISQETLNIVSREIVPLEMYVKGTNESMKRELSKLEEKHRRSEELPIIKS